ncbi:MAG TPA: hypothetical protein ENH19_02820, partial [Actinobacteria bacterium]|nr:hypothetical protein [Actinomycetes bacterium]HEX21568.1 hypothetical protein [Actinomycetota bacterium]
MDENDFDRADEPEWITPPKKASPALLIVLVVSSVIFLLLLGLLLYLIRSHKLKSSPASQVTKVVMGTASTYLGNPLDVALLNGKFYVTDGKNRRVVVFLDNGRPLFTFRGGGPHDVKNSSLLFPVGIDVNS